MEQGVSILQVSSLGGRECEVRTWILIPEVPAKRLEGLYNSIEWY